MDWKIHSVYISFILFQMLAAGSLAFAKAYSSVEKLENELEAEIQRDTARDPKKGKGIQK